MAFQFYCCESNRFEHARNCLCATFHGHDNISNAVLRFCEGFRSNKRAILAFFIVSSIHANNMYGHLGIFHIKICDVSPYFHPLSHVNR